MARPAKAYVNLDALRHNYKLAARLAPDANNVAAIKANAYGHGAVAVAKALEPEVSVFGVACIEEALELRAAGIGKPILLLEGTFTDDEVVTAAQEDFWLMVENRRQLEAILNADLKQPVVAWIKVDSGMHRLGVQPADVLSIYQALQDSPNVQPDIVLATHFACSDELDNDFTLRQIQRFKGAIGDIKAPLSMANSGGVLAWEVSHADWNRPGYMLYGSSPFAEPQENADQLKPVMTLKSAVISVRDIEAGESVGYGASWVAERPSRIATVAIGYGDGYPRHAVNGTPVLINGQRVPLAGRVSMDMITVDITDCPDVEIGVEVTLWGEDLPVNEIAEKAGTIGYELLTRMPLRTPRIYIE